MHSRVSSLHPVSFSTTCGMYLLSQGYDKTTAKKHLLVFALAAPLAAFASYFGLVRVSNVQELVSWDHNNSESNIVVW